MGIVAMLAAVLASLAFAATNTPNESNTVLEVAQGQSDLSDFTRHVSTAGLDQTLSGTGPFTVFAPTNSAFNKVPRNTMNKLMSPTSKPQLQSVLKYHVVRGSYPISELKKMRSGSKLTTIEGKTLTITRRGNNIYVDSARLVDNGIQAKNGILYKIDTVMMPPR